jgi:hypothetical protein
MTVADAAVRVQPCLAAAVAAGIDDRDRNLDEAIRLDRRASACRTVKPAAGRRAGNYRDRAAASKSSSIKPSS